MVITVEMYKQVRRMYLDGVSQRQIAKKLGISRHTVKKYVEGNSVPWERKPRATSPRVLTDEVTNFIQMCIDLDEVEGNKKQRHTARRIYNRLVDEQGFTGGESTIRRYIQQIKGSGKEAFVPLDFPIGDAIQIDWGECRIWLNGQKTTVYLFCARLCYSNAPFVVAYRRQNSESFLDALVKTFEYFGGTPKRVIFDNARIAVKDGFGKQAKTTDSYAALAAHYGFEAVFCNPASGNEKGLVEGLVGFSRRNFCVPVPTVKNMEELNIRLKDNCEKYLNHKIRGKESTVGVLFQEEKQHLYSLPKYRYDPAKRLEEKVTAFSTVRYETNNYSVPVKYCGKTVTIKAHSDRIKIFCSGEMIADHERSYDRQQDIYSLEHYLPLLERKGRALLQAKPVRKNIPGYFLEWLERKNMKPKELVELLECSLQIGFEAAMKGEKPHSALPVDIIPNDIPVVEPDLSSYDLLYTHKNEEAAI